ncbi:MAG: chromosomal replication initiator protein DnaA [Desulfovibrio sp.]|uniref:chromosomal replication initiator protein DnaA n=1 Tax=Desulfovibrio sp. TaxID=885 RepID=UPI001A783D85|nr:chromosomal replication initiator protein DnaA [Desulfovibrio sp.]MBD5417564.1 chromosomal replication initiator protein DnaA [Desulfovibrio sp.]
MQGTWADISANLKKMLDSGIFRVWIAPLRAVVDGTELRLTVPSAFMAEWLERHLLKTLREAAAPVLGVAADAVRVRLLTAQDGGEAPKAAASASSAELVAGVLPRFGRCARAEAAAQMPLPEALPRLVDPAQRPLARWRHSFEDFIIGPSNSMAVAAARDICQRGGQVRTLFVTGASGLGKTHLTQSAGHAISGDGASPRIAYLTAEEFASRFVQALKCKDVEGFKSRLRELDVLLLEDVHFLQRKKAMQELALAVIKGLQDRGGRVILTSSFAPRELRDMDPQLVSHFCSGILTSIGRPDREMRSRILTHKARTFQVLLPDEVRDLLASRLHGDVRQLESCLNSLIFKARLLNCGLNVDLAMEVVGQYAGEAQGLDMEAIIRLVCESYGLSEAQLRSRSRRQECVQGRNTVFYLARKHTELSLEDIGSAFNRRHSTVLRSITAVERELAKESRLGRQIARAVSLIERSAGCGVPDGM